MKLREPDLILFNMGSVVLGSVSTNGNEYKSSLATILASRTLGPTKSSKQDPKSSQQTKLDNARTNGRIGAIRSSKKSRETRSRRDHGNVIESHLVGGFFFTWPRNGGSGGRDPSPGSVPLRRASGASSRSRTNRCAVFFLFCDMISSILSIDREQYGTLRNGNNQR